MKRRPYGVNLDDGVALASEEEFDILFVDARPNACAVLKEWLANNQSEAILFGGQIGTGKTTLLNQVLRTFPGVPPIRIKFDTDCIDATDGGYVLLMLGQVLTTCLDHDAEIDGCGLTLTDFASLECTNWAEVARMLATPPVSLAIANRLRQFAAHVTPMGDHMRRACGKLLDRLAKQLNCDPILVADGVDKFALQTSDYDSLKNTLTFLAGRKTLFEVNAVHLFNEGDFRTGILKLFIGGIEPDILRSVFSKRLGAFSTMYEQAFPFLASLAGGNTRQGLRLLNAYYFLRTQKRVEHTVALAQACHRVSRDLLSVSFGQIPNDVARVVRKDGYIEGSVLDNRLTAQSALDAVYRNWILLEAAPNPATPTRWPARMNPLVEMTISGIPSLTPSTELELVRNWALSQNVSPLGLNVPVDKSGDPEWGKFWEEIRTYSSSGNEGLSILHVLEEIGAGLFGVERQDRIIVTYKNRANLEAVRDFLVGKANTYSYLPCHEITLLGGEGRQPIQELLVELGNPDPNKIYSVDLDGDWTDAQLRDLEHRRDLFDKIQMLWWVQQESLERYKPFWPQLRQLFRIYRLELEIWHGLKKEDIEADIELIRSLSVQPDPEGVQRLKSVLTYLLERGGFA